MPTTSSRSRSIPLVPDPYLVAPAAGSLTITVPTLISFDDPDDAALDESDPDESDPDESDPDEAADVEAPADDVGR